MEPPKAHIRAFQLTAEEAKSAPDVVAGTFSILCLSYCIRVMLIDCTCD